MHTQIRVADYSGKIDDLTRQYPFDNFFPVRTMRTDVEKLAMLYREDGKSYTIIISKDDTSGNYYNTMISVSGPEIITVSRVMEQFQKSLPFKTKPAPQYLRDRAKNFDTSPQPVKSLEDLFANCLVCDACQTYYLFNHVPRDVSNQEKLQQMADRFLTERDLRFYSISPRIQAMTSEKLKIQKQNGNLTKKDLYEALGKFSEQELIEKIEELAIVRHFNESEHKPLEALFNDCLVCLTYFEDAFKSPMGKSFSISSNYREIQSTTSIQNLFLSLVNSLSKS